MSIPCLVGLLFDGSVRIKVQYIYNIFIHAYKYIACKMCIVLNMVYIYKIITYKQIKMH